MTTGIEVLLTSGAYSDYGIIGLYRVPNREWVDEQWASFVKHKLATTEAYHGALTDGPRFYVDRTEFAPWIITAGALKIPQLEAHLGDYAMTPDEEISWREPDDD
jgi:hypothetical protein